MEISNRSIERNEFRIIKLRNLDIETAMDGNHEIKEVHLVDIKHYTQIGSMDFLNFVIAVHRRLNVEIPEFDYPKLVTLDGAVAYLHSKVKSGSR